MWSSRVVGVVGFGSGNTHPKCIFLNVNGDEQSVA